MPTYIGLVQFTEKGIQAAKQTTQPTSRHSTVDGLTITAKRVAASSSTNAVNLSSACTTKRFPSSRCASATNVVRPLGSTVATQPQLQPALLRFVSDDFPVLHTADSTSLPVQPANVELEDSGAFLIEVCLNLQAFCLTQLAHKFFVIVDK